MQTSTDQSRGTSRVRDRWSNAITAVEGFAARRPFWFALLTSSLLFLLTFALLRPTYDTIDDVLLNMIVAGKGFVLQPDAHMIHSNIVLGELLKSLYTAWPSLPWYGCFMILVHLCSQTALLYCAIARGYTRTRLGMYLACFTLVGLVQLTNMQFTTTAFLATESGILLMWLAWLRRLDDARSPVTGALCWAVLLLLLGALVRIESFYMAVVLSTPVGLLLLLKAKRAALAPVGAALAIGCAVVGSVYTYDYTAYHRDPEWRDFLRRDELRKQFNDYQWTSYTPETASAFAAAGWSPIDHELIYNWYYDDPDVYTEAKLTSILQSYPWRSTRLWNIRILQEWKRALLDRWFLALFLAAPFVLLIADPRGPGRRVAVVGLATSILLLVAITLHCKVPPMRVYFPLMSYPLLVGLLFVRPRWKIDRTKQAGAGQDLPSRAVELKPSWWRASRPTPQVATAITALFIVALVMSTYKQVRHSYFTRRTHGELQAWIDQAMPNRDMLYVLWGNSLPLETLSPLESLDVWGELRFLSLSWTTGAPFSEEFKRQHQIRSVAESLHRRDDLVLIAYPELVKKGQQFIEEHYGVAVELVPTQPCNQHVSTGRLQPRALIASRPTDVAP